MDCPPWRQHADLTRLPWLAPLAASPTRLAWLTVPCYPLTEPNRECLIVSFEIIADQSGITPEWMTRVLRSSDTIAADTSIASIEVQDLAASGGLLSELFRATMTYKGGDGPATAIIKLPINDETQRFTADVLGFYARELAFYDQIAPSAPFDSPAIYGSRIADDTTDFVLVMQDAGDLRSVDQVEGVPLDDVYTALTKMAEFHAAWWEHDDIPALSDTFLPIQNEVYLAALPGVFEGGWGPCKATAPELLTPATIEFGDRFGELVPWLLDAMSTPATFVHGDWRSDNVFYGDGDSITMIDFQISGFACGMYDVGYFLGQSVDSDLREGKDEELIRHYLSVLAANGVDYSFDEAWEKYQIVLSHCFIYGVTSFASWEHWNERQRELMLSMLGRSVRAITDSDALSVLPPA